MLHTAPEDATLRVCPVRAGTSCVPVIGVHRGAGFMNEHLTKMSVG